MMCALGNLDRGVYLVATPQICHLFRDMRLPPCELELMNHYNKNRDG